MSALEPAAANLLGFARLLRAAGFRIAPEQAVTFIQGVVLLGPRSMDDIREAACATLAPPPDRIAEFDALYRSWFWGDATVSADGGGEEETRVKDDSGGAAEQPEMSREDRSGELASVTDRPGDRAFASDKMLLDQLGRRLSAALPTRRSFRDVRAVSRGRLDLRRSLSAIVGADGDIPTPVLRRRAHVARGLLLLIDISGSMKRYTADYLRLAHAIVQNVGRVEVFTLGTRLTRITPGLRLRARERALARVADLVDDWDGGTRIGPTLLALLGIPRFGAFARGAVVAILSDGLERGSHVEMETAIRRLSARAFRLSLFTPLAADPRFQPRTAGLAAILPYLDDLADGSSIGSITDHLLSLASPAAGAGPIPRKMS
jgi:uncharacterized protein with von Willebrand factor type A (vWA) domain